MTNPGNVTASTQGNFGTLLRWWWNNQCWSLLGHINWH